MEPPEKTVLDRVDLHLTEVFFEGCIPLSEGEWRLLSCAPNKHLNIGTSL